MKILKALLLLILIQSTVLAASSIGQDNTVREDKPVLQDTTAWESWPTVGQATLSWFLFDIYNSELKSPTGRYLQGSDITPHPMALSIVYRRDITKQQLIEATAEQWLHLGYSQESQKPWLKQLNSIYPDIKEGERLVYITDGAAGEFHFYGKNKPSQRLGEVESEQFNDAFLSIWLAPETEYPKLRAKLIGMRK